MKHGRKGYRLLRASYRARDGTRRTAAKWYVAFKDHLDVERKWPAFTDTKASDGLGRNLARF